MQQSFSVTGKLVDIRRRSIEPATIHVRSGRITQIEPAAASEDLPFILPGFVDAHVHIESSMLVPSVFARLAVVHGTVATVSDPHEIANVCGIPGVDFMIENGNQVPFKFCFGAPSCVPATTFESAGATLGVDDVSALLQRREIYYLSEMMNFPGVLQGDADVLAKIEAAKKAGKPVDGHAPGLRGNEARQYIAAGISTDHECFTAEEALDKLAAGMKILIREGSAAKNFEALADLLHDHFDMMMFCSDDKHPDSLVEGHINDLCARAVSRGVDVFKVLQAACLNPVAHYNLPVGTLNINDPADFILVEDLEKFKVIKTFINGDEVASEGLSLIQSAAVQNPVNNFHQYTCTPGDFVLKADGLLDHNGNAPVIEALDGQLITNRLQLPVTVSEGNVLGDTATDVLKIAVVNRYREAPVAVGLIKNFGLKKGAIASSVAHDSHNIVAVGVNDEAICRAVNLVMEAGGGVSLVGDEEMILPLPVGGLMSVDDGYKVANAYAGIDQAAKELGSPLQAPFMTLSFMALLVIPHLKMSDLGLFDGGKFEFVYQAS